MDFLMFPSKDYRFVHGFPAKVPFPFAVSVSAQAAHGPCTVTPSLSTPCCSHGRSQGAQLRHLIHLEPKIVPVMPVEACYIRLAFGERLHTYEE